MSVTKHEDPLLKSDTGQHSQFLQCLRIEVIPESEFKWIVDFWVGILEALESEPLRLSFSPPSPSDSKLVQFTASLTLSHTQALFISAHLLDY